MQKNIKQYAGLLYIALMTAIIAAILIFTDEWRQISILLETLDPLWTALSAGCILCYLLCRVATLRFYLRSHGHFVSWREALAVSGAGQFYSAITPSASGGQPMQIWELHRRGVPVSLGTACVSVKFIGFQAALLLSGGILWISNREMVAEQLWGFRWLVALGYALNIGLLLLILLAVSHENLLNRWIRKISLLCAKLRLIKSPDTLQSKLRAVISDYCFSLKSLLQRPKTALSVLFLSLVQVYLFMSVPVCMYHALGLSGAKAGEILTLQYLLFISAAFIPLPGASGAQESGFCLFFRNIFPESSLTAAMVCWRFLSYYLLIFAGLLMMAVGGIRKKNR